MISLYLYVIDIELLLCEKPLGRFKSLNKTNDLESRVCKAGGIPRSLLTGIDIWELYTTLPYEHITFVSFQNLHVLVLSRRNTNDFDP